MICITHDVSETRGFPHVVLLENGHIVEDGDPQWLADDPGSRYRAMLEAEEAVRQGLWESAEWRRFILDGGRLRQGSD